MIAKIKLPSFLCFLFSVLCLLASAPLPAFSASAHNPKPIVLQLKWKHQFQFAGYYAAIEQGYYAKAGLKVVLREGRPGLNIANELLSGRANFAVAMPNMLLERQKKKPIVALAAIFQHSPEAMFVRRDSGINTPHDLIGKKIMLRPKGNIETRAMLLNEGIKSTQINIVPHSWNINDLISGKVDATAGYLTDRPFILQQLGVAYSIIRPLTYGIDFYGDCLFTTEKEIDDHPQIVKKFLAASLQGWEYAMNHPEQTADLILQKYSRRLSKKALLYEAGAMQELMQPRFIEIGHMNPGRWKHIADTFVQLGMLKPGYSLDGFLYNPAPPDNYAKTMRFIWGLLLIVAGISIAGIILLIFNRKLKREVTARTAELEQERQLTNAIMKTMPGAFYVYEDGERLIRWNENFQQESGFTDEEMAGRHPLDWFSTGEQEKVIKALADVRETGYAAVEANITFKRGEIPYYFTGTILDINNKTFMIGVGIDLTVRRQLEAQLRQAQKMESIGRLAGGVAHDFNNVLTTILGYTELLLGDMAGNDPHWEKISIVHSAGERAAALTRQLLAFSRKQIIEKKVLALNTIINDLLKILGKMLGEDIIIKTHLEADGGIIEADTGQIEQILMNLTVNARDAMPQGGEIIIETKDVSIDQNYADLHSNMSLGSYVMLAVTDSGEGMSNDVLEHIFDPFFTTKEKGKGTGLGLATVYGIVKQHGGYIYVYSEINQGTTFKIYLQTSRQPLPGDTEKTIASLSSGDETIMVVDDEPTIRTLIMDTLTPLGYKCLEAGNGREAIEIILRQNKDIDLLLTDVVMPGMSGKELAGAICAERPDVKVIFMSGYTENTITHHGVLDTDINYIPKPIAPATLTQKIRLVLNQPPDPAIAQ